MASTMTSRPEARDMLDRYYAVAAQRDVLVTRVAYLRRILEHVHAAHSLHEAKEIAATALEIAGRKGDGDGR